ncbi:serine/threonine protein kinase [Streptomyces sp. HC44]|uniref:non-specific serine/threonine protein kinase n=1 Tax=Streptomyces scabichelini TaxID=2711217 RepID=A0A6G4VEJ4_9ACTN|nr:serine/threonine-protein kinase [Streptomyces scabichelini]NGO12250.1 serine/threonine protein kinase [Streptomyces scabichelini]
MTSDVGRLIGGRYRLTERIGSGGMGTVWRAVDELVERDVAVKEPRLPGDPQDPAHARAYHRLQREARAAARVEHPGAVAIHDVVVEDGLPWIVMELIRGESLHEVLRRGALSPVESARIGLAVVGALRAAHTVGIVHRDVKPANVLLGPPPLSASLERGDPHGRVVLTDFGIAHIQGEESLTVSGEFVGSLEFIAPERMSGRGAGPASDLWSLGVLLYAAVEGWSPFRRTTVESTLAAILSDEPPEPKQAGDLGPLITQLLAKEPGQRPDADKVAAVLEAVAEGWTVPDLTGTAGEVQSPSGLREFADDAGTVRLRLPSLHTAETEAAGTAAAGTEAAKPGTAKPGAAGPGVGLPPPGKSEPYATEPHHHSVRRRRPSLRLLAASVAGAVLLTGGIWLGISFRGGDPRAEAQNRGAAAPSASTSTSASPSTVNGWTVHTEKDLDAILSVPVGTPLVDRFDSGADRRNPSRSVVYGDKTVQLRLTREDAVPTPIESWADEATLSYADDSAKTLSGRTSFHGYEAMLLDTEYEVKEEKYRVMQLLIVTDAKEYYELRADMPKGTKDEKRGTSLFEGARDRLKVGRSMVGSDGGLTP